MSIRVDDFCRVNSPAGNTAGLQALAAAVMAEGGGVVEFTPNKEYVVGVQTAHARPVDILYTFTGARLLEFANCSGLIIRGNGARLKCADGLRYGAFNADGSRHNGGEGYYGPKAAVPYTAMLRLTNVDGWAVYDLEFDGNLPGLRIGGPFSDTGIQLPCSGIDLQDSRRGFMSGVTSHRHGLDGIHVNGAARNDGDPHEQLVVENCRFTHNGRNGRSMVGGRGSRWRNCEFSWNGNVDAGVPIKTSPASGSDFEAEGGRMVADVEHERCVFVGNGQTQVVADSGTRASRIGFTGCRFVATRDGSVALWPNRPFMRFSDCLVAGTVVHPWRDKARPEANAAFERCTFTNADEHGPGGRVASTNRLLFDAPDASGLVIRGSTFDFAKAGPSSNFSKGAAAPTLVDCTIVGRDDPSGGPVYPAVYARFEGRTEFVEQGDAVIQAVPGGGRPGKFQNKADAGPSKDPWAYTQGGNRTVYPPT